MVTTSTIAGIGALLGDPARVNMMVALLGGRALTARELADIAGVAPQTASSHIGKLAAAGMVRFERQGRHRYHRLASSEVAQLLEQMHVAGVALGRSAGKACGPRDPAMRELRSCYDHLAGRVAVEISEVLLEPPEIADAAISGSGLAALEALGVDLAGARRGHRVFCRTCLDWSERRPHLAGAVGAALLERVMDLGWARRREGTRALGVSLAGERGLREVFGVAATRSMD